MSRVILISDVGNKVYAAPFTEQENLVGVHVCVKITSSLSSHRN